MSIRKRFGARTNRQRGISLMELLLFIVIVSVGIAGILSVMSVTTRASADPLQRKQALAIAEALLEEVSQMPFTDCDPDGFVSDTVCNQSEVMGPEGGPAAETRGSLSSPFDNVNDYNGFQLAPGAGDIGNSSLVTVPSGYRATVTVAPDNNFGPAGAVLPTGNSLRIAVTVTYNNNADSIVLEGYRARYAPNGMP
ncbi:MAG: type IV pilus modification PilV family protein [Burkholderiaceae bacterium]